MQKVGIKSKSKDTFHGKKEPSPSVEAAPTREQMELPASYREERAAKRAEREAADIEDLVSGQGHVPSDPRRMQGSGRLQEGFKGRHGFKDGESSLQARGEKSDGGRFGGRHSEEQESDRRGRGRGRERGRSRRDREEEDDYYPQRRKENFQLFDFIQRPEPTATTKPQQRDENVLEDYDYDPIADQYIPKVSSYSYPEEKPRYGSGGKASSYSYPEEQPRYGGGGKENTRSSEGRRDYSSEYGKRRSAEHRSDSWEDRTERKSERYYGGHREYGGDRKESAQSRGEYRDERRERSDHHGGRSRDEYTRGRGGGRRNYGDNYGGRARGEHKDRGSRNDYDGGRHEYERRGEQSGRGRVRTDHVRGRSGYGGSMERSQGGDSQRRNKTDYHGGDRDDGGYQDRKIGKSSYVRSEYGKDEQGRSSYVRSEYGKDEQGRRSSDGRSQGRLDSGAGRRGKKNEKSGGAGGERRVVEKKGEVTTKKQISEALSRDDDDAWGHLPQSGSVPFRSTKVQKQDNY